VEFGMYYLTGSVTARSMAAAGGNDIPPGPNFMNLSRWEVPRVGPLEPRYVLGEEVLYRFFLLGRENRYVKATIVGLPHRGPGINRQKAPMIGFKVEFIHPDTGQQITDEVPFDEEVSYIYKYNVHLPGSAVVGPGRNEYIVKRPDGRAGP